MLKIRPAQLRAFAPAAEAAFERRVAAHIREEHPDEVVVLPAGGNEVTEREVKDLDDETLLRMVRAGVARARSYGMTWESSVTAFVVLMFTVAPNFDDHPLIRRVLEDAGVEPDLRIERLWEQVTEENWTACGRDYKATAWGYARGGGE